MKLTTILLLLTFQLFATTRGDVLRAIKSDHVSIFINSVWDDADSIARKYNLPQGLLISMAALESGWGRSKICKEKNNYLGIKSTKKVNGKRPYRTFKTRLECFDYWGKILTRPCYQELPMTSLNICLYLLESCGYHQSENYSNKIRWIYKRYKLNLCDDWKKTDSYGN